MHDGNQRLTDQFPLPDTMHPNGQSETRQTPFLPGKSEKREQNFGKERVGMELIKDKVF